MKAQPRIPQPDVIREDSSLRASAIPPPDAHTAANDDTRSQRRRSPLNPLWVINIAMAAFFISAALIMMFT